MPTNIDGGTFGTPNRSAIKGQYFQPWWFTVGALQVQYRDPAPSGGGELEIYQDRSFFKTTVSAVTDYSWPYTFSLDRAEIRPITRVSSDESVIFPNPADSSLWTYASSGTATLALQSEGRNVEIPVSTRIDTVVSREFIGFNPASVAYASESAVLSRANAVLPHFDAETHLNLFTETTQSPFTRNPNFFAADIDFTCLSVRNTFAGTAAAGTLISPRHIVFANHFFIAPGTTLYFVTADNQTVARTILKAQQCVTDIAVGFLNEDVPASIRFVKILPNNPLKIPIPAAGYSPYDWPVLLLVGHFDKKLSLTTKPRVGTSDNGTSLGLSAPTGDLARFFRSAIQGDSGSPIFMIFNEEPVLCSCLFFGGNGSGPLYSHYIAEINATMTSLSVQAGASSNYQVTEADISGFAEFP